MMRNAYVLRMISVALAILVLYGCATLTPTAPESLTTYALIQTLRTERVETLYYKEFPKNVKELMVRPGVIPNLARAYDAGGDNLYRFNILVVVNHRSSLSDAEKLVIVQCLERAIADPFAWVRTEAVWGIGLMGTIKSAHKIIPLLDDPDPKVVNEAVLTLFKLTGMSDAPLSNQDMSSEERLKLVKYWKGWWENVKWKQSF